MLNFKGKLALVTGASSGIGYEIACELVRRGCRVIAVARREEKLKELQAKCGANNLSYIASDLCNPEDLRKVTSCISSQAVDVVINNAGRGSFGAYNELPLNAELEMITLNVSAFTAITHAAISFFRTRGSGAILGVSSVAAFQPLPFMATYAATKAYEYHLFRALRAELAGTGISITSLNPGPVATEFGGVARVPGTVTGFRRDGAQMVAKVALDALASNKPFVVPGLSSTLLALGSRFLPTWLTTFLTAISLRHVNNHKTSSSNN